MTVTITHSTVTGAAANLNVLVDGPKWDANHVVTGLENVDNTSDVNKPVSTAQAAAIAGNILINGGMEVDQANAGAATPANGYAVDGWQALKSGTMVCAAQQVTDAPAGFSNSLKITVSTAEAALAAGDYTLIYQNIEGYRTSRLKFGTAGALSITLGFWTKIHRTGAYSGALSNNGGSAYYPFTFTQNVADTWEYKTVTISGDITGTWLGNTNAGALQVIFAVAAGSTFTATAGAWASIAAFGATGTTNGVAATTDVFQITGVTLLPGTIAPTAAQSVLLKLSFDQELVLCQRYYEKSFDYATAPAQNAGTVGAATFGQIVGASASQAIGPFQFRARKRVGPTMTSFNPSAANAQIRGAAADWSSTAFTNIGEGGFGLTSTSPVGSIAGQASIVHWIADARIP